jgi:hypothetical protein
MLHGLALGVIGLLSVLFGGIAIVFTYLFIASFF